MFAGLILVVEKVEKKKRPVLLSGPILESET